MSTPENPPAFPTVTSREEYTGDHYRTVHDAENGMSLRDYFAIHFAAASCSRECVGDFLTDEGLAEMSRESYKRADAMLAERSKR